MAVREIIKLRSKKYGVVSTMIDSIDLKLDNGYIVLAEKNNKILTGFIDQNYKLVIDFGIMSYNYHYISDNDNDMFIAFKCSNGNDVFYHLRKEKDSYTIINKTNPKIKTKIITIDHLPNYWIVVTKTKIKEYSIYSVEDGYEIVDGLSDLTLIKGSENHKFQFKKILYSTNSKTKKSEYATTITGYLDENCHFSSDILDLESNIVYDGAWCDNFHSQYFSETCTKIIGEHVIENLEKKKNNLECLREIYFNPIERKDCIMYDFNSRKKVQYEEKRSRLK